MAYEFQDIDPENIDFKEQSDDARKKRLALAAAIMGGGGGGSFTDFLGQYATDRMAKASDNLTSPVQSIQDRLSGTQPQGPVGPVMPQEIAQQREQETSVQQGPVAQQLPNGGVKLTKQIVQQPEQVSQPAVPEQIQQQEQQPTQQVAKPVTPEEVQLPQPGPATQVAGPTQLSPGAIQQVAENAKQPALVPQQDLNSIHQDQIVAAHNEQDPTKRRTMYAQLLADKNVSEDNKKIINQQIADDYFKQKGISDAEQKIAKATPNDLARYMQERKEEGSYLKAILYHRLGLTELAQQEQEKISPTTKMESATSATGGKYTVVRNKAGEIVNAFTSEGKTASPEEIANLSAEPSGKTAMYTGGSKVYTIPKGDANEGNEYTSRFNTHLGRFENIITTGPNAGKLYTGAPGLEKRVETSEAITANKQEASKGLIDYRLQQNLKYAGPMAYTKAGAHYVGRYNAENGTNLGYNRQGVLVDHNNDSKPVVQNKDGSIAAVQRVENAQPAPAAAPAMPRPTVATAAPAQETKPSTLSTNLGQPPAYDNTLSPLQNKKIQDNWAANRKKVTTDFITGKQGQAVQSMNVAVDHLDSLQEAANALKNGDVKLFNQIGNAYSRNTGSPAVTDFNAMKSIVGSEVAKAVAGGATALGDREEIRHEIDAANSPDQLAGVISKYQKLLAGQVKGLRQTYVGAGLPAEEFDNKLLPRTKKVLGTISGEEGTPTVPQTPAEKAKAELERRKRGQ